MALAKADGHVHEKERAVIFKIGNRYGLKERQVQTILDSNEKFKVNLYTIGLPHQEFQKKRQEVLFGNAKGLDTFIFNKAKG